VLVPEPVLQLALRQQEQLVPVPQLQVSVLKQLLQELVVLMALA
jgi:hypothetical protein